VSFRTAVWSAALALATLLAPVVARATAGDSTLVAGPLSSRPYPRIALAAGRPCILYATSSAGQTIAWLVTFDGPSASYETVASDLASDYRVPLLAVSSSGAPLATWFTQSGRFVVGARTPEGWAEDSSLVDVPRCAYCQQWLAADPLTGEPRIAYTVPDGSLDRVRYAARENGAWSVADVDPAPVGIYALSLALDPGGRPWVAYEGASYDTLFLARRDLPGGPFVREAAAAFSNPDAGFYSVSVETDPASGEPRVAYYIGWADPDSVGYAFRDGGMWTRQYVERGSSYLPRPVTLALDAAGNPTIAWTQETNILAGASADAQAAPLQGGTTGEVLFARRTGATGTGPFTIEYASAFVHDMSLSAGALAVTAAGYPQLAAQAPDKCSPCYVVYIHYAPPLAVPPAGAGPLSLAPPAPDPARAGQVVRLAFTLPAADVVTLDLLDLAGRRVAALEPRRCIAGPGMLEWSPGPRPPGIYFVRLRSGSGMEAVRRLVMLR
jgi:hypothetical protein